MSPVDQMRAILAAEATARGAIVAAEAGGDAVHEIVKRQAISMPSVSAAIAVGMLIALQVYLETIEFARRSMDGDEAEAAVAASACARLFADMVEQAA